MKQTLLASAFAFALFSEVVDAQISAIGQSAFGGATKVTFNSIADEQAITNQYSGLGVTFSGGLIGLDNARDLELFPAGATMLASNWNYTEGKYTTLKFSAHFNTAQHRLGFYVENWDTQLATVEFFSAGNSLGSLAFGPTTITEAKFFGAHSTQAFDEIRFTNTDERNGFYAIDDFQFSSDATSVVPEPSTVALMATGLLVVGVAVRRKQQMV